MLQELTSNEIKFRVKAVNRSATWLASAAKVAATTVLRGPEMRRKHRVVVEALAAEELRLLRHLAKLHPQAALDAATVALCPEKARAA